MYTGFSVRTLLKLKVQCFFGVLLVDIMRSHLLQRFVFSFYHKGTRFLCLNVFVSGLCCNGLFMSKKYIQIVRSFESVSDWIFVRLFKFIELPFLILELCSFIV